VNCLPKISIVTPSYNQSAYLEEALLSVKSQDYPRLEHLVVDGASSDGSVEILKKLSGQSGWEHLHWVSERDDGQSDALNKGFQMARGDIVGWLNSDDRYRPGCFQLISDSFSTYRSADVIYGDYTWIDERGRVTCIRREIEFSNFILAYHRILYIPTTSTFFRRRIFDEGNAIDTRLHYSMDYDFFLRLASRGYRFQHIPQLLADFRWHQNSKSGSQSEKQLDEHNRVAVSNSRILRSLPEGKRRKIALFTLRKIAASLRYAQKFARGYYREQHGPFASDTEKA
jgi:glycosyltransferase involved in cell wall biosynthesis